MERVFWCILFVFIFANVTIGNNLDSTKCYFTGTPRCFRPLVINHMLGNCIEHWVYVYVQININNIKKVKQLIDYISDNYPNEKPVVYVGAFDTTGYKKEYLDDDICQPVPEYIYHVIVLNNLSLVFVTLNNPVERHDGSLPFCDDRCEEAGIFESDLKVFGFGYTICCSWENFKKSLWEKQITDTALPRVESQQKLLTGIMYNNYEFDALLGRL